MKRLVAIQAELVRVEPAAASTLRRRLLVERAGDVVDRIPVRVTELAQGGCTLACQRTLSDLAYGSRGREFTGLHFLMVRRDPSMAGITVNFCPWCGAELRPVS